MRKEEWSVPVSRKTQEEELEERLEKCEKENIQLRNALAEEQDASAAARAALEE